VTDLERALVEILGSREKISIRLNPDGSYRVITADNGEKEEDVSGPSLAALIEEIALGL